MSVEREVVPDFSLGVNYIYKGFSNLLWNDFLYFPGSTGVPGTGFPLVDVPAERVRAGDHDFQRSTDHVLPALGFLEKRRGAHELAQLPSEVLGIEVSGNRRLSHRWMMNFGLTYSTHREYFDGPDAVYDPTNFAIRDGGLVYYPSTGSGKSGFCLNSRWNFKIDGLFQLPAGINLAGKLSTREGFIFPRSFRTPNRAGGLGRTEVFLDPIGDSRLEDLWVADLRVEKVFNVGRGRLSGMMDVFNLFDASTVLGRERRQNLTTANRVQDILSARVVRFGVRVNF